VLGYVKYDGLTTEPIVVEVSTVNVAGRYVFYNNSIFDEYDPAVNDKDDGAVAPDKQALLPGQTATFANYTSYSRGINGIMVDVAGLPEGVVLTAENDFIFRVGNSDGPDAWSPAPITSSITIRHGAGSSGSDRVTLVWDDNDIQNQWLRVTVLATENTGLGVPDVFYFGNAPGESGNATANAIVSTADEILARNFVHGPGNPASITDPYDFNRDGLVNTADRLIARSNRTGLATALRLITVPAIGDAPESLAARVGDEATLAPEADLGASLARDAVFGEAAPYGQQPRSAKLDWLHEFEHVDRSEQQGQDGRLGQDAVDRLLAAYWPG
jgi:hypothetical protein